MTELFALIGALSMNLFSINQVEIEILDKPVLNELILMLSKKIDIGKTKNFSL